MLKLEISSVYVIAEESLEVFVASYYLEKNAIAIFYN